MTQSLPLITVAVLALATLLLSLKLVLTTRALGKELERLRQQVDGAKEEEKTINFSQSLARVERAAGPTGEGSGSGADKYRYVAALAGQGVDAEGIAAALQMAPAEVEQLMQLARLKKQVCDAGH